MERDELVDKIDLAESQMKPYEGFIFLCGGPTDITSTLPISIRDALLRQLSQDPILEPRIRVAEHFKDWSADSLYRDLVSFERHLAELSSVIVLVLESPGSIAELGLFSAIDAFHNKLLVVIETEHYLEASFIRLGPVDYLEKSHDNKAQCHRWFMEQHGARQFDPLAARELQSELAEAITGRAKQLVPQRRIQLEAWLDRALLICDLLSLCSALTVRELSALLGTLGCMLPESEVRQTLFLLEKVRLVAMEPKGDQRFYVSIDPRRFVQFRLRDNTFDVDRFRMNRLEQYERTDKKRFRAVQAARRRNDKR